MQMTHLICWNANWSFSLCAEIEVVELAGKWGIRKAFEFLNGISAQQLTIDNWWGNQFGFHFMLNNGNTHYGLDSWIIPCLLSTGLFWSSIIHRSLHEGIERISRSSKQIGESLTLYIQRSFERIQRDFSGSSSTWFSRSLIFVHVLFTLSRFSLVKLLLVSYHVLPLFWLNPLVVRVYTLFNWSSYTVGPLLVPRKQHLEVSRQHEVQQTFITGSVVIVLISFIIFQIYRFW